MEDTGGNNIGARKRKASNNDDERSKRTRVDTENGIETVEI